MKQADEARILIVDDESAVRKFLRNCLVGAGWSVSEACTGNEAIEAIRKKHPDLVILDLGLPDLSGFDVTRIVREWNSLPILILSVRDQEEDIVGALDAGADDYLTKPFSVSVLLARIRAALRRTAKEASDEVFRTGDLEVDLERRVVSVGGRTVSLTPTEYDLLKAFVRHAGRVLTHRQLLKQVWGNAYLDDIQVLRVNISNLRKKIETPSHGTRHIVTEPGVGYRLA